MRGLFIVAIAGFIFASCVSNKKILLVQQDDLPKTEKQKNQVIRTYQIDTFEYKVQSNDILSVRFESLTAKEYDMFTGNNTAAAAGAMMQPGNALLIGELVDEHGEIPIPLIGRLKVAGLTIFEIQDKLQNLVAAYGIKSPIVRIRLLNYRVTVLGEVRREGTISLTNNRVSVLEALGLAGGFDELADRSQVKLIRQLNNRTQVIYLNLLEEGFIDSPYYYIHQNDILVVPPLKQRPFRKYFGENLALFVSTVSVILLTLNLIQN